MTTTARLLTIIVSLMFFNGCSKPKPEGDATTEFWAWFGEHSAEHARLLSYEAEAAAPNDPQRQKQVEQLVADTASRLRRINSEFSPFFGSSEGANQLMITVRGQKQFFAAADQFVTTAPKIAGWTFTALKPPLKFDANTEIKSGSVTLKLGGVRYTRQRQRDGSFAFIVFVPANVSSDPDGFRRLCTRLLEDAVGERLAATAIQSVEVRQLDTPPQGDLLEFINAYHDLSISGAN